ncbi:MAG: hypothetical protein R3F19_34135 [Verrucomicrobiales bacterium]
MGNGGIKRTALHEAFGGDPRTIKKWANALKSGDAQKLIKALTGRGGDRKLTLAVVHFVRRRIPAIYREDSYTYSSRTQRLQVPLSGEALRPLLGELKSQFAIEEAQANTDTDTDDDDDSPQQSSHRKPTPASNR